MRTTLKLRFGVSFWNRLLYWGWLRMVLGVLQMSSAAAAVYAVFKIGFEDVTVALVLLAFATTALSRWLYRGKPDPSLEKKSCDNNNG